MICAGAASVVWQYGSFRPMIKFATEPAFLPKRQINATDPPGLIEINALCAPQIYTKHSRRGLCRDGVALRLTVVVGSKQAADVARWLTPSLSKGDIL